MAKLDSIQNSLESDPLNADLQQEEYKARDKYIKILHYSLWLMMHQCKMGWSQLGD